MSIVSTTPLPKNLFVALNNVPRFSVDGRFVFVGASLSEILFTINVETGTIAGSLEKTNAVVPAPFADGATQMFAVANLGTDPTLTYRLKKSGSPRAATSIDELENGFVLVGNDPIVAADGSAGFVPNYGRSSLIAFDPRTGALRGELSLGKGPGQIAIDRASGTISAIELNGSASRILIGNLSDLGDTRDHASVPRKLSGAALARSTVSSDGDVRRDVAERRGSQRTAQDRQFANGTEIEIKVKCDDVGASSTPSSSAGPSSSLATSSRTMSSSSQKKR
jgi:hypothetical protein